MTRTIETVHLKSSVRGKRLIAYTPDVRYRHYHEVYWGEGALVVVGRVYFCTDGGLDIDGIDQKGASAIEPLAPPGDPEVLALIAECAALDAAWWASNNEAIALEAETQRLVAEAVAREDTPHPGETCGYTGRPKPRAGVCPHCGDEC